MEAIRLTSVRVRRTGQCHASRLILIVNRKTVEAYGAAYAITVSPSAVKARHPASCDNHITLA
jgi:hypothetical protein